MADKDAEHGMKLWSTPDGRVFAQLADGTIVGGDDPPYGWTAPVRPPEVISLNGGESCLRKGDPGYAEYIAQHFPRH